MNSSSEGGVARIRFHLAVARRTTTRTRETTRSIGSTATGSTDTMGSTFKDAGVCMGAPGFYANQTGYYPW